MVLESSSAVNIRKTPMPVALGERHTVGRKIWCTRFRVVRFLCMSLDDTSESHTRASGIV